MISKLWCSRTKKLVFFVILSSISASSLASSSATSEARKSLYLSRRVLSELNQLLNNANDLHAAMLQEDDDQVELSLKHLILQFDRTYNIGQNSKSAAMTTTHLLKMLETGRNELEMAQFADSEERRQHLQASFDQMVNLVRTFAVNPWFGIFFCPKDKSSWVQRLPPEKLKGQNPFQSGLHHCGIRVPRSSSSSH